MWILYAVGWMNKTRWNLNRSEIIAFSTNQFEINLIDPVKQEMLLQSNYLLHGKGKMVFWSDILNNDN